MTGGRGAGPRISKEGEDVDTVVQYKEWPCRLKYGFYAVGNGRIAIQLIHAETGELVSVATVNLPHVALRHDEVLIKDYSENEGMLEALVNAGVVEDTGKRVASGYVEIPVCRLLKRPG